MSLKDLFKNKESFKVSPLKSSDDISREIGESSKFIKEFREDRDRFVPPVDYGNPANFARYGSAEKYYEDSIKRIYNTYPYDGSHREKLAWHNSSSHIDNYIFENEYPRTNGHALFSADGWGTRQGSLVSGYGIPASSEYEYIIVRGGPNTGSSMTSLKTGFSGSNIYDADSNRQSNLEFNLDSGVTVEFWLKKDSFETSDNTEKEVIFDLWNGRAAELGDYGRLRIELNGAATGTPFLITALSGTSGLYQQTIGSDITVASLADWNHYAISLVNGTSNVTASLYVNGVLNQLDTTIGSVPINAVTGNLSAYIGALRASPSNGSGVSLAANAGAGKLSASLDEFRYWKTRRTSEDIGRYWFTHVHGGTNTDVDKYNDRNPVDLGVYFKFNEGVTGYAASDSTVLDYSGRYTNGEWIGYDTYSRSTVSAIVSAGAASTEFKDPIIYSFHPDVVTYSSQKQITGSAYDVKNNAALYSMLPRWVIDDDAKNGENIKNLTQILASYFDMLHLQIQALPMLREATYSTYASASADTSAKPLPFANRLLESLGLETPELFIDAEIIEKLTSRDEVRDFKENLHDIKNLIYHNIYNNLAYIYKSKGTEKSFRNLIRCFGVDDELIKFNIYGRDVDYELKNNFKSTTLRKNVVNFDNPTRFDATIYQHSTGSERSFITGSGEAHLPGHVIDLPCTFEAGFVFPRKRTADQVGYFNTSFITSSLFGVHGSLGAAIPGLPLGSSAKAADTDVWTVGNSSVQVVEDTTAGVFAIVLKSGVGVAGTDASPSTARSLKTAAKLQGPLTVTYKYIAGTHPNDYDPGGLNLDRPEYDTVSDNGNDTLYLQYSTDGTNWTTVATHLGASDGGSINEDFVGGVWRPHTASIETTDKVFLRWNQPIFAEGLDHWALDDITVYDNNLAWASGDAANFQVYAVRTGSAAEGHGDYDSKNAFFMLTSSNPYPIPTLTSSVFSDVYDSSKWDFAVRINHDKYQFNNMVNGVTGSDRTYSVEFYGVNTILDEVINEFTATGSVDKDMAENFLKNNKRLYLGAHRTNFTGTLLQRTDVKAAHIRYWQNYLNNDVIKAHAKDVTNYGLKNPYRNYSLFHSGSNYEYTPSIESLALNWDFENVSASSDASGRFAVFDYSSGSLSSADRYPVLGSIAKRKHPGRADFFPANSSLPVEKHYFHIAKQQLPEQIFSDDMVTLVDEDDLTFTRESRQAQYFFAAEKSMYQTISEEMINMFATIVDFNNLIGEPVNRYRHDYKDLTKLRQLFFERIENTPDLNKYVDFYKWIDRSVTVILEQLSPASANVSDELRTMIESHILERSKYPTKFPLLKRRADLENLVAPTSTPGNERPYSNVVSISPNSRHESYGYNPPPVSGLQSENCHWWLTRTERSHPSITSGDTSVDKDRDKILSASSNEVGTMLHGRQTGPRASTSRRGVTVKGRFQASLPIHGGVNFRENKNIRYAHIATTEFGPTTVLTAGPYYITASNNFVLFLKSDVEDFRDCTDKTIPSELDKKKWNFVAFNNSDVTTAGSYDYNVLKGSRVVPFNLYKHDIQLTGGYHTEINNKFKSRVDFTNIHVDTYGSDNEVPMQGPFTARHVGGLQHRHVDINTYDSSKSTTNNLDDQSTRPEDWFITLGSVLSGDEAVAIVGPTYTTTGEYDKDTPRARFHRGLTAKRPVNIRNIRTTDTIVGNYSSSIEYVSTTGRSENNAYFKENEGVSLPALLVNDLPKTTNTHTLIGVISTETGEQGGNFFGPLMETGEDPVLSNRFSSDSGAETVFTLPRRDLTGSNSVIVSRFSAPGGPEIMSRGYLDINAEEYSVYNALPFRNLSVRSSGSGESSTIRSEIMTGIHRDGLRTLLTRHCGQFGIESQYGVTKAADYDTVPAFHKTPRNVVKRIEYSNEETGDPGTTTTGSVYNNYWFRSLIPASDLQYKWLTASFESYPALAETYGYASKNGLVSSSVDGIAAAYNFVSASQVTNADGIVVPFAAHNTYLVDGVVSEQNLLSASSFPNDYVSGLGGVTNIPEAVHGITLLRHGPYQWPTWKQVRNGENQIVRYQKKNNIFSFSTQPDKVSATDVMEVVVPETKAGVLRQFVEPAVTSKYKPLVHVLQVSRARNPLDSIGEGTIDLGTTYTYSNKKGMFPTPEVNFLLNMRNGTRGKYEDVRDLYLSPGGKFSTVEKFMYLSYRETVYPKERNTYLSGTRSRITFDNTQATVGEGITALGALAGQLWRSNQKNRIEEEETNSQNQDIEKMSVWPLDARDDFATAEVSTPGTGSGTGEVQNLYTIFHNGENLGSSTTSTKSVKFGRRAYLSASTVNHSPLRLTYQSQSAVSLWFKSESPSQNVSSSLVSIGRKDTDSSSEAMTFDIRLEGNNLRYNIGAVRGGANEGKDDGLSLSDNKWHHLLLAWYYNSESDRKYQAFVDGNRTAYGSTNMAEGPASGQGSHLVVGANPPDNSGVYADQSATIGFRGFIDEITFFTGSLSSSAENATIGGFSGSQATTLYNGGNPIDVINADLGTLKVISHYRMGEHANDGPLGKYTGFIQDVTTTGVSAMTGNLSASVTSDSRSGFANVNQGIVTDSPFGAADTGNTNSFGALYSRQVPERTEDGEELGYYAGDTLWEAASQAGKEPMYDDYNSFREDFRGLAKDYTIVPEFRISNHMNYYLDTHAGDFLADNEDWLQLEGAATNITSSGQDGFFKTYTNSDFLKFFDVVRQDHSKAGHDPTAFALKCNAVIKFLPYEGFYPAERTAQLATLISSSFADRVNFKDPAATSTAAAYGNQVSMRTFLAPIVSPGVLYNSIKAGIAVDHPIMTASFTTKTSAVDIVNEWTGSNTISSSFGFRVPFEVLAEPQNYLAGPTIVDYEPHPSASINSTASWDGSGSPLFELAMNNFLAEVPKFFLKDQGVTSVVSAKDNNKKYFKADSNKEYRMRVVLRNGKISRRRQIESNAPQDNSGGQDMSITGSFFTNPTITMYSRRSAFGPPVHADHIKYNESYEPFTPPHMDGYADVELSFKPEESRFHFIDEIVSEITSSYFRIGEQYFGNGAVPSSIASQNQMHISASLNLLEIAKTKKATYDPVSGEVLVVEDDAAAPSVAIIQTKWETPILDFSNVSVTLPQFGSGSVSKGMWHQYGSEPSIKDGVFLEIQDLTKEEMSNPALTGSLADLMGFSKTSVKLGQPLGEKTVHEAVVAIPFIERRGKKEFFNIPRKHILEALSILRGTAADTSENSVGQSVVDMVDSMRRYVFPPRFDFVTNTTVDPLAMYIFEFEHKFNKQDLIDMWQNLTPEIGRKFKTKSVIVKHGLMKGELMGEKLERSLRWMVFKVKQKASDNYFEMLADSAQEKGFKFEFEKGVVKDKSKFNYSYNWPYDFFSLVEMVKIDAEAVIKNKSDEE